MALYTSSRVVNENPGSVTVIVREASPQGANDALVSVTMEIDTDEAAFAAAGHTAGYGPNPLVDFITWSNVAVPANTRQERTAIINKNPNSDASATTVLCIVSGTYQNNPYFESCYAVITWP